MSVIEAVFFDAGDTLVDLGEGRGDYEARLLIRAGRVYDVLAAAGQALPERERFCTAVATGSEAQYQAALTRQQGLVAHDALRLVFADMQLSVSPELLLRSAEAYSGRGQPITPLRLGARDLLVELRARGLRLGLISNTIQPGHLMDDSMAARGLLPWFTATTYSSDVGVAKPHPEIFRTALARVGVAAERSVYVGDRLWADVHGAQSVGMRAVLIEVPGRPEEYPGIVPDVRIKELPELVEVLAEWEKASAPEIRS